MTGGRCRARIGGGRIIVGVPMAPACSAPQSCGRAPRFVGGRGAQKRRGRCGRPFGVLQDLLKKT